MTDQPTRIPDLLCGIDLGGTKIEGIVLDQAHNVLLRKRIPTEGNLGYEHVLSRVRDLVNALKQETGCAADMVGIGMPGTLDPQTGLIRGSNSVHLNHKPLDKDLQHCLGSRIVLENDANCFALAETRLGVVADTVPDAEVVFGVIMGTGVGGGLVINDRTIKGCNGIAGEWGHNYLDASGGVCYCGRTGCVETVISGPATERYYAGLSGSNRPLSEIVELAGRGDAHGMTTINRLTHFFGKGLAYIINILDPDAIVIGGGVGNIDELYSQGIEEVRKHVFSPTMKTRILRPKLGDSAGVFGAALLCG